MRSATSPINLLLSACLVVGACSDQGPTTLMVRQAPSASGDGQTQLVDAYLQNPIRVLVTEDGAPKPGVEVVWETSGQGATVGQSTITGQDGMTQTFWKMPNTAGPQEATATVAGADGSPVTFTATAIPGPASRIFLESGDGQTQKSGLVFSEVLAVRVTDRLSNSVAQAPVRWELTTGSVIIATTITNSGTDGIAEVGITAGPIAGAATVSASLIGGSPSVVFHVTVEAP
ncbi:MAG TPA: Ig-like domain-containing protein [Gemmatimonadales bacterium]|nr:Ig-like domain-containing protein [Gemmatimonadales bacterium]